MLHLLARVCHHSGLNDLALDLLAHCTALRPDDAEAWCALGEALARQGHPDRAAEAYRHALVADSGLAEAYSGLGHALAAQGRTDDDATLLSQAIARAPDRPVALAPERGELHYRLALAMTGQFAEAWTEYGWRWQTPDFAGKRRDRGLPAWDGQSLPRGRLGMDRAGSGRPDHVRGPAAHPGRPGREGRRRMRSPDAVPVPPLVSGSRPPPRQRCVLSRRHHGPNPVRRFAPRPWLSRRGHPAPPRLSARGPGSDRPLARATKSATHQRTARPGR